MEYKYYHKRDFTLASHPSGGSSARVQYFFVLVWVYIEMQNSAEKPKRLLLFLA